MHTESDDQLRAIRDRLLHALNESAQAGTGQVERALERLEAGTYGTCERCGKKIDAERLRIVPFADVCQKCGTDD